MHEPELRLPGISVREAAIRLGTSESDIRRRIKRGALRAESFDRPGGTLLRVLLDPSETTPEAAPATPALSERGQAPDTRQDAPEAAQALTAALETIAAALADERAERQRLAEENAALRERVGRAETRAEALQAGIEAERAEVRRLLALLGRPWYRRLLGLPPA